MTRTKIAWVAAVAVAVGVAVGAAWDRLRVAPPALNAAEPAGKAPAAADKDKAPDDQARQADQDAVRAAVKDFIKVFEKGDAKGLAAQFTAEGEYVANDGATLRGRAAMEDGYAQFFKKNPDLKLEVTVDSVRFVSRDDAVVEGSARSYRAGKPEDPTLSRISALVRPREGDVAAGPAARVARRGRDAGRRGLADRHVGVQKRQSGCPHDLRVGGRQELHPRPFHDQAEGQPRNPLRVTQLIGRDPRTGQLHSWLFENDGGFGEADWTWDGKAWSLAATGVEPDGDEVTATNMLTPLGKDAFTWQSINRTVNGEDVTDIAPVKVTRVK